MTNDEDTCLSNDKSYDNNQVCKCSLRPRNLLRDKSMSYYQILKSQINTQYYHASSFGSVLKFNESIHII